MIRGYPVGPAAVRIDQPHAHRGGLGDQVTDGLRSRQLDHDEAPGRGTGDADAVAKSLLQSRDQ